MSLRVAIAHDWLVTYAGSERVVEQMLHTFPGARLLTSLIDRDAVPPIFHHAEPSFLQGIPGATRRHEYLLPLMPLAWRLREPIDDVDIVISSSHACAKAVRVTPGIPHLCYCHTPMRYAWQFDLEKDRFPRLLRPVVRSCMSAFRHWDRNNSRHVSGFIANSSAVADRIRRFYGRNAEVIHPPVATEYYTPSDAPRDSFFLYVGRLVPYKVPDLVVRAFATLPTQRLVVVGDGPMRARLETIASPNVHFAGRLSDDELRSMYRRTQALIYPAEEDFGIVMAEAQACGALIVAAAKGGASDIVTDTTDGILLPNPTPESIAAAVAAVAERVPAAQPLREAPRFSEHEFRTALREAAVRLAMRDSGGVPSPPR